MGAATVVGRDDPSVRVGKLIATCAEHGSQRSGQGEEETAGLAVGRSQPRHRSIRPPDPGLPALCKVETTVPGEHPRAALAQFEGNLLDGWIVREQVARRQPRVVRRRREHVARAQIAWLQPFGPRHPFRGKQRSLARK
jgi:hypothetical protein